MIEKISIVGAGTMGGGIAISAAQAGCEVLVFDLSDEMLEAARARATQYFERQREKGKVTREQAERAQNALSYTQNLEDLRGSELVIEAVFEDLTVKSDLFQRLSKIVSTDALIATNTSALRVTDLARSVTQPDRFLGLHYFSPAEINPLVELVAGPQTTDEALSLAQVFLENTGKTVLRCRDAHGFAVNRFFCPYANEAVRILDDGLALDGDIDAVACQTFDLAMGPFAVMRLVKPRIMLNAVQSLAALGPFYQPARGLVDAGAGAGNFPEKPVTSRADDTHSLVQDRLTGAVFLPILEAACEHVAQFEDFDLGAGLALRFGRPPVAMMRHLGRDDVLRRVALVATPRRHPLPIKGLDLLFD